MALTVTITKIDKNPDGSVEIHFGKRSIGFSSVQAARDYAQGLLGREVAEALAVALLLTRQPNINNPAALEGHSMTVDLTANTWGTVT